ncbi:MAG TPA: hypothetical protein PLH19_09345 [Anaerolineae bacterium]|nr:hypothetical protein [Anaerolineae bacterium]HQH38722.1 hypothetical protein [Anaerolineae bacterium]
MSTIPNDETAMAEIQSVKERYEADLLKKPNVVGVGVGLRMQEGKPVGEPGLIVNVTRKIPPRFLRPQDRIPKMLDGVPVWIEVIGEVEAQG